MALPVYSNDDQAFQLMQSNWAAQLNPLMANPILKGLQIDNVTVASGSPAVINHLLSRMQQGWLLVDQNAPAKIARIAPLNSKTLTLSSDASVTISLWVY